MPKSTEQPQDEAAVVEATGGPVFEPYEFPRRRLGCLARDCEGAS